MKGKKNKNEGINLSLNSVLAIIVLAALVWYFLPAINAKISGVTVGAGVVVTPTLAPGAPAGSSFGSGGGGLIIATPEISNDVQPPVPAPAATVRPARADVAAAAAAQVLTIVSGGRVYELTGEQLVDCANAQINGLRSGPKCPPDANSHLYLLGQGR